MEIDAKTGTQGSGEQTAARGGSDKCEGVEVNLNRTGRRTFIYHDINAIVLHRRIEILFYDGREAVNLIDEKHIVGL